MLTYSGCSVYPELGGVPTPRDVSRALSWMPRFGGHARQWWTVLQHSICAYRLAYRRRYTPQTRLLALIHDAHEAVTGDIPSTWKTKDMRERQDMLDRRFEMEWELPYFATSVRRVVKMIDEDLLLAEGYLVGPPGWTWGNEAPQQDAVEVVQEVMEEYWAPDLTMTEAPYGAQHEFLEVFQSLRNQCRIAAVSEASPF